MEKGISAIIATILLLLITIALAGTAYIFTSGMLQGKTDKSISVLDAACTEDSGNPGNYELTVILANDGTETIDLSDSELTFIVDNTVEVFALSAGTTIDPHTSGVLTSSDADFQPGVHTVVVTSPSNSVQAEAWCA